MAPEIDQRAPDAYVEFTLGAEDLPLGAQRDTGPLAERALLLATALASDVAGAEEAEPIAFRPDPTVQTDRSGGATVHVHQNRDGIGVFGAQQSVGFAPGGSVDRTQARLLAAKEPPAYEVRVASSEAVRIAAGLVAEPGPDDDGPVVDVDGFEPAPLCVFAALPELPTVFAPGPFAEPISAYLVWFPLEATLRLAWRIALTMPAYEGAYELAVTADDGTVVYCTQTVMGAAHRGDVYALDPTSPRALTGFPRPWSDYALDVDAGLLDAPPDWVADDRSEGYAVTAYSAETKQTVSGVAADGVITFDPPDALGAEQWIVNAFYGTCAMHDVMYLAGFREADGSYEEASLIAGLAGHRLRVAVSRGKVWSLANCTPAGILNLGVGRPSGGHTALDMTIVFHEYTHAVSNRLVGGGMTANPLTAAQSRGMSEGWGDYVACTVCECSVVGAWATGDAVRGLRRFAYDDEFPVAQAHFADLASLGTYGIGELWCAFLLDFTRVIGRRAALPLVIDGMKGLLSGPSLLDARNNLLLKLDRTLEAGRMSSADHAGMRSAIWASAARFGMGVGAQSMGATLEGVEADDGVPSD